jgi:hypothetical protein
MPLSPEVLLLIGVIAAAATLGVLYTIACSVRDAVEIHDLRVRAIALRNERIAYLREQSEADTFVTEISLPGVNAASPSQEPAMTPKTAAPAKKKH